MTIRETTPATGAPAGADQSLYDPITAPNAPNIVPDDPYREQPDPERVDVDTYIERPDLGEGATTLIAAGDPVPEHLAQLPRRPRDGKARAKAKPST